MFQRLAAASRRTVERVHGEAVIVYPVTRPAGPNSSRTVSLSTAYETVACFFENTLAENDALSRPLTGDGRLMHSAPAVSASVTLVEDKGFEAGMMMQRVGDSAVFEVSSFKPDGLGAVYAALNRVNALPEIA